MSLKRVESKSTRGLGSGVPEESSAWRLMSYLQPSLDTDGRGQSQEEHLGLPSSERTGSFRRVVDGRKTDGEMVLSGGALFSNDTVKIPLWGGHHGGAVARERVSKVQGQLCFLYELSKPWYQEVTEQCV